MFTIAIVGRPNVGKSTLFNRLTGRQQAIVDDQPGVTRDRREGIGRLAGLEFGLVDTAGLEEAASGSLQDRMRKQTEAAIAAADLTLLVFDAREGVTPMDTFFANHIRRSGCEVICVGNKCEGRAGQAGIAEAYGIGLGDPVPVSAAHGEGLGDLHDALVEIAGRLGRLQEMAGETREGPLDEPEGGLADDEGGGAETWVDKEAERPMRIAVVGRPNMGKSTLVNHLVGEERLLTGPEAGITRDAIEIPLETEGGQLVLIDTAGMRRRARIGQPLEKLMVDDALNAIRFSHVCILMIDAREPLHRQDLAIARLVAEEGRAMVVGANMWDAVKGRKEVFEELRHRLDQSLGQVRGVPLAPVSALKGSGVGKLMRSAFDIYRRWNTRISTSRLNRWLELMLEAHPPPMAQGRRLRIRYATQVKTRPPTFALFTSRPSDLPDHYLRYLSAGMRDDFELDGVPLRLLLRKGGNPYAR